MLEPIHDLCNQSSSTLLVNYGTASMILAAVSLQNPAHVSQRYQVFLLSTCLIVIHATISSMPTRWIANFNAAGSTYHMLALIVVIIIIPAATNRESQGLPRFGLSSEVWGTIYPGTEFSAGIGIPHVLPRHCRTLSGYDAPFHLSGEC